MPVNLKNQMDTARKLSSDRLVVKSVAIEPGIYELIFDFVILISSAIIFLRSLQI